MASIPKNCSSESAGGEAAAPAICGREAVLDRIDAALDSAGGQRCTAVLYVRLLNAEVVRLGMGYAASDRLLAELQQRLAGVARRRDWLVRVGDGDFVLLLSELLNAEQALLATSKLLRAAKAPMSVGAESVPVKIAIGVAAWQRRTGTAGDLLIAADRACAHAQVQHLDVHVHVPAQSALHVDHCRIESLFEPAFERGEFELHYQPKIILASHRTIGAESLVRWKSRELGAVSPADFVPVAERTGHIERLTWSTLNSALQQLGEWQRAGLDFSVAANISPRCLRSSDFGERFRMLLGLWNVPPSSVTLEITESAIMEDVERGFAILRDVRDLGARVSIDDFGTGYSSLSYFRSLPADELKIDRSFVKELRKSASDRQLVQSVIDLAHGFGMRVVAEGIENAETALLLQSMRCDIGQGFHFSEPLAPAEMTARLRREAPQTRRSS